MDAVALGPTQSVESRSAVRRDLLAITGCFLILTLAYWLGVRLVAGPVGFPLDDAYIHLQFARNLFEDGQMAFNRGVPSSGCTAPLYPVLLAGVYTLVRNWYLASAVLGGLCGLATAWVVYALLHAWTGRRDLARAGGLLAVLINPTVISAYSGMETPLYTLLFLVGLWLYAAPGWRALATVALALCVWVRPEFVILLPLVALERAIAAYRAPTRRLAKFAADLWPHVCIWAAVLAAYFAYHWHQDRHLLPTTFGAKAFALGGFSIPYLNGLPAAVARGGAIRILLALTVWPLLLLLSVGIGLGVNCAPLALGLREAALAAWRDTSPSAAGRRLALLVFLAYPAARALVDPGTMFWYQFQRYYAHLSFLLIVLVLAAVPVTGTIVQRQFWNWTGVPLPVQLRRTLGWACPALLGRLAFAVIAVSNINTMQVHLGAWVREHTAPGELVATNDIGAIGFISRRPILDTVGLIEPQIVEHYLHGGKLLEYLKQRNPAYVIFFPNWYTDLAQRTDRLERVYSVALKLNVICGGRELVVYRPRWYTPPEP